MKTFTTRIARGLAAAIAAAIPASLLMAAPAHALDHYTLTTDSIALPNFTGTVEEWHNAHRARITITGTLSRSSGCTASAARFVYVDGSTSDLSQTLCSGASETVSLVSDDDRDVVRAEVRTGKGKNAATLTFSFPQVRNWGIGADYPVVDRDNADLYDGSFQVFDGDTTYEMDGTSGNIRAGISGSLRAPTSQGVRMSVTFVYADGSTSIRTSSWVYEQAASFSAQSDGTKDVREVRVRTSYPTAVPAPSKTSKLGLADTAV